MTTPSTLSAEDRATLDTLFASLQRYSDQFVGYPCNLAFDYREVFRFLEIATNNLGDPFGDSNYRVNTHALEREVVSYFANLFHAPADNYWGYVTNGGTEGNMYGLYLAREILPDGIVYFSEDTHYSVVKILHVLGVRNIMIRSLPSGEIDYEDLRETIRIHRDVPPIIFANIGTTMKGAIDDVPRIKRMMKEFAVSRHYIHADAALSGMILPFVDSPQRFDFAAGADSVSVSGHKMIGSPIPCGVAVAKRDNVVRIGRTIEYVGALDTTIMGSRNGITPLFLWYAIHSAGQDGFRALVRDSIALADYAIDAFKRIGVEAWRHENSITVVFPRPSEEIVTRWQIAPYQDIAHIITLPHVTREKIDRLVAEIAAERAASALVSPASSSSRS